MKKVLLIFFLLWPIKTFASGFQMTNTNYVICDEESHKYPVHYIRYNYYEVYFLNLNENYNYNFNTYHEYIEIDEDYAMHNYLWAYPVVNYNTFYNYYMQFITRLLWESIYYDKQFHFCEEDEATLERKEEEYQLVKARVEKVLEGIDFFNEDYHQRAGQEAFYEDEMLSLYTLVDDGGLEVSFEDDDKFTVKGEVGEYYLVFNLKHESEREEKTFTDGINKIATYVYPPPNDYYMRIFIDDNTLSISFDNFLEKEICINIASDSDSQVLCTSDNSLFFEVNQGNYHLNLIENDYYDNWEADIIIEADTQLSINLTQKTKKEVYINVTDEKEKTISFVAKNTFIN